MRLIVAESAGFCYGVERAVRMAEETAAQYGRCVMLGSIIHNAGVVRSLEEKGAVQAERVGDIAPGERVLIRAHGAEKETLEALRRSGAELIDATCPHVLRLQQLAAESAREGRRLLIIGEPHHPEVVGIASYADEPLVFDSAEAVAAWLKTNRIHAIYP